MWESRRFLAHKISPDVRWSAPPCWWCRDLGEIWVFSLLTRVYAAAGRDWVRAGAVWAIGVAVVVGLTGCGAQDEGIPDANPAAQSSSPITTTWSPPADPTAQGATSAPHLPEEGGALDQPLTLSTGMVVSVDSLTTTTITPETPGEYAGSAVIVALSVRNTSEAIQTLDSAVVTLVADDGEVGVATTAGRNRPLAGMVAVGETVEGSYVFMLDPAEGRSVVVSVNYAAGEPIAHFEGKVS